MSYLSVHSDDVANPRFTGHVWRSADGHVNATVDVNGATGRMWFCFDDPADARALAAECIKAAEAIEQFGAGADAGTATQDPEG